MNSQFENFDAERLNAIPITGVARRLGDSLKRVGALYRTICPWHDDHNPSLTFYERTNENRCHCFSCGKGGDVIAFTMQHEQWSFQEACRWLSQEFGIPTTLHTGNVPTPKPKPIVAKEEPVYTYIPMEMVDELVTPENSLCQCLMRMFSPEAVQWVAEEYRLGCYSFNGSDNYTVFPAIDVNGRVRNLKIQRYDTDPESPRFGHSDKDAYWLGKIWAKARRLPENAQFQQACLFGEHLLNHYPGSMVALVESPKNALYGALSFQQLLWIATGNKNMCKREVLLPLKGRDVMVIPDRDAVSEWTTAISDMADLANFKISDYCERCAPHLEAKYDIADFLQTGIMAVTSL